MTSDEPWLRSAALNVETLVPVAPLPTVRLEAWMMGLVLADVAATSRIRLIPEGVDPDPAGPAVGFPPQVNAIITPGDVGVTLGAVTEVVVPAGPASVPTTPTRVVGSAPDTLMGNATQRPRV